MPSGLKPSRQEKLQHLDVALSYVTSFRLAVDVGAHIGNWSLVMAQRFDRVLAFEPLPENQERWREKMAGIGNAELVCGALGDLATTVRLDGTGHSKHFCVPDASGSVSMYRLDDYELNTLDFLKIDAEGADALVLRGATETIRRCRPVVIVESKAKFEARYGLPPGAPMTFLEQLGARRVAEMWCDYLYVF